MREPGVKTTEQRFSFMEVKCGKAPDIVREVSALTEFKSRPKKQMFFNQCATPKSLIFYSSLSTIFKWDFEL